MLLSTAEDLARFVQELRNESDRGLALVAAALIDDRLAETLRAFFREGPSSAKLLDAGNAPLGSMSARGQTCHALGLIDDNEFLEISLIRKVRNEFAHAKHGISFKSEPVNGFCSSLQSDLPASEDYPLSEPRFRFTNATMALALRLYHRPEWVALERRTAKTWVDPDLSRWRNIKTDPPPPGLSPIVVLGRQQR